MIFKGILLFSNKNIAPYSMDPVILLFLYLSFRAKHFLCDFVFQTDWMALNKGKPGKEGYKALFPHTAIHAVGTFIVVLIFAPSFWWLGIVDFFVHSIVDRVKGVLTYQKEWQPSQTIFWWAFGVDQEFHNVTHIIYIALIYISVSGILG